MQMLKIWFKRLSNMQLPMSYWVHSSYSSHKFWLKIIVATMIFSSVCFRHIIVLCKSRRNEKMWTWTLSAIYSLITLHCILYESEVARCRAELARQAPGSSSTVMWWSDPGLPAAACRAREWASDSNTAEREREIEVWFGQNTAVPVLYLYYLCIIVEFV